MYEIILMIIATISIIISINYINMATKYKALSDIKDRIISNLENENKSLKKINLGLLFRDDKEYTIDDLYGMEEI